MSPPPSLAATVIARASFVKSLPLRESTIAFLCLMLAHLECPDMASLRILAPGRRRHAWNPWVRYHAIVRRRPSSSGTCGRQPVSARSFVESTYWRSISPCGLPRAADVGLDVGARERGRRARRPRARGAAAPPPALNASPRRAAAVERVGDRQVGGRGVLDVEEVALGRAVGADDGRAAGERGGDGLGDQPRGLRSPPP